MKAMILAAGYAMRLKHYTENMPKALLEIGGRTLLDRLVDAIDAMGGVEEIVLVSNHRYIDHFREWLAGTGRTDIVLLDDGSTNNDNRLGAIGDMAFALRSVPSDCDWFVAASDNLFDFPLDKLKAAFQRTGAPTLCAVRIPPEEKHKLSGLAVATLGPDGRVISLVEKPKDPPSDLGVYALYFYPRGAMQRLPEYLASGGNKDAPGFFPTWLYRQQAVYCTVVEGTICDVGTVEELERLRSEAAETELR